MAVSEVGNLVKKLGWDPKTAYHASPEELKACSERFAMKQQILKRYQEQSSDPHFRLGKGRVFDPAMQRWYSMRVKRADYFKANKKTGMFFFFTVAFPILLITKILVTEKESKLKKLNKGYPICKRNDLLYWI